MSNKDKTVSFRVNEETFEELRAVAEARDVSLSSVFREYADTFVEKDGRVRVVAEDSLEDPEAAFPPTVEVPTSFVREHERLELEAEHLRESLEEHKRYIRHLQDRLEADEDDDVVSLEELDAELASEREGDGPSGSGPGAGPGGSTGGGGDERTIGGSIDRERLRSRDLLSERDEPYRLE